LALGFGLCNGMELWLCGVWEEKGWAGGSWWRDCSCNTTTAPLPTTRALQHDSKPLHDSTRRARFTLCTQPPTTHPSPTPHAPTRPPPLTASKALVRHIKEGQVPLALAEIRNRLPLLRGGVDAGGVVGAACGGCWGVGVVGRWVLGGRGLWEFDCLVGALLWLANARLESKESAKEGAWLLCPFTQAPPFVT